MPCSAIFPIWTFPYSYLSISTLSSCPCSTISLVELFCSPVCLFLLFLHVPVVLFSLFQLSRSPISLFLNIFHVPVALLFYFHVISYSFAIFLPSGGPHLLFSCSPADILLSFLESGLSYLFFAANGYFTLTPCPLRPSFAILMCSVAILSFAVLSFLCFITSFSHMQLLKSNYFS